MEFIEETEVSERGIRRLAQSRGTTVTRTGVNSYLFNEVAVTDDEVWDMIQNLPQTYTLGGKGRRI